MNIFRTFDGIVDMGNPSGPKARLYEEILQSNSQMHKLRIKRHEHWDTMEFGIEGFDNKGSLCFSGQADNPDSALFRAVEAMRIWRAKQSQ